MSIVSQILLLTLPGMLIAVVASLVTVRLSIRQFYTERWWKRKATAYNEIMKSLYYLKTEADRLCTAEMECRQVPEDVKDQLAVQAREGDRKISEMTAIGAFAISDRAAACLARLDRELQAGVPALTSFDYYDNRVGALSACINEMRSIAEADLNVRRAFSLFS